MSWQEEYARKVVSAEIAVRIVESGDRVVIPLRDQPLQLVQALAARGPELRGVDIVVSNPEIDLEWFLSANEGAFHVELENFIGARARPFHDAGQASYLPLPFSLGCKAVDQRPLEAKPIDVMMATVTPPDENGMVSFGPQLWYKRSYVKRARKVLAEVNSTLIRPRGDCFLPVSSFDYFVEVPTPSVTREGLLKTVSGLPEERRSALEEIIALVDPGRLAPLGSN